jgi:hypothetical protein
MCNMDFSLILAIFLTFCAGIGFCVVLQWFILRKATSLNAQRINALSLKSKQDMEGELMAALTEASLLYKEGMAVEGADALKVGFSVAPKIAMKYPRVALKFGKDIQKLVENMQNSNYKGN